MPVFCHNSQMTRKQNQILPIHPEQGILSLESTTAHPVPSSSWLSNTQLRIDRLHMHFKNSRRRRRSAWCFHLFEPVHEDHDIVKWISTCPRKLYIKLSGIEAQVNAAILLKTLLTDEPTTNALRSWSHDEWTPPSLPLHGAKTRGDCGLSSLGVLESQCGQACKD